MRSSWCTPGWLTLETSWARPRMPSLLDDGRGVAHEIGGALVDVAVPPVGQVRPPYCPVERAQGRAALHLEVEPVRLVALHGSAYRVLEVPANDGRQTRVRACRGGHLGRLVERAVERQLFKLTALRGGHLRARV